MPWRSAIRASSTEGAAPVLEGDWRAVCLPTLPQPRQLPPALSQPHVFPTEYFEPCDGCWQ
jgi:hypothetical protein